MRFVKGHGTENDFVVVPDLDDALDLTPAVVAAICDRRAGLGADGVLRVVRGRDASAPWFMDYRNADGSLAEMCGNGLRVYARWLVEEGLADPAEPISIATRGGVRVARVLGDGRIRVDMGVVEIEAAPVRVATAAGEWDATGARAPNPHAVAFVADLASVGPLRDAPTVSPGSVYPHGVNVEFVADRGERHLAMRVHERGSGETRSCGTGVCAVAAVAARRAGEHVRTTWTVDVPGGRLNVDVDPDGRTWLTGPAVLVGRGELDPAWLGAIGVTR